VIKFGQDASFSTGVEVKVLVHEGCINGMEWWIVRTIIPQPERKRSRRYLELGVTGCGEMEH
jgi:hypothetical protein